MRTGSDGLASVPARGVPMGQLVTYEAVADTLRHIPNPDLGYGQSWCLVSSSGLVLGLLNGFAVAEVHALDHLGETLRAVQPAPVPLGGLGELEDHGERGLA